MVPLPTDSNEQNPTRPERESSEIMVAPGPGGLTIFSEDEGALNEFENLLSTLSGQPGGRSSHA